MRAQRRLEWHVWFKEWSNPSNAIVKSSPSKPPTECDFVILAPVAEKAPLHCRELIVKGVPFACLVPSDLVNWISVGLQGKVDSKVQEVVGSSAKVVFLNSNCVWLIVHDKVRGHAVFHSEAEDREAVRRSIR